MSSNRESQTLARTHCIYCGADWKPYTTRCWICRQAPPGGAGGHDASDAEFEVIFDRIRGIGGRAALHRPFQFGLSTLLVIMTLVCIVGSITRMAPGLGIAMMVLGVPALVHTCVVSWRHQALGEPMSRSAKAQSFAMGMLTALLVTALAGLAASVALFVALFAVCAGGGRGTFGNVDPGVAAATVGIGVIVVFLIVYFYVQYRRRRG